MAEFKPTLVIDASEGVLGRIASYAAKQALLGKVVAIVNSENALITGQKLMVLEQYKIARGRGGSSLKGPNISKKPEMLMKRTVRGMLSYKEGRGAAALDNVRCYVGVPKEFENIKPVTLKKELKTKAITLKELSRIL